MQFNREKFKALVHYICRECRDPSKLGKTKLHKILWFSDGQNYMRRAEPITGERYIKMLYGPCADHLDSVLKELVKDDKLFIRTVDFRGYEKFEFFGKGDPDKDLFSDKELLLIDGVIKNITEDHTATSISDRSHNAIWEMAVMGEELPYEAILGRPAKITDDDLAWAKSEIASL